MLCPRCDEQGEIYKAKILDLNINLLICDECEACWNEGEEILLNNFKDLSTFLEKNGCSYVESKIVDLDYNWDK